MRTFYFYYLFVLGSLSVFSPSSEDTASSKFGGVVVFLDILLVVCCYGSVLFFILFGFLFLLSKCSGFATAKLVLGCLVKSAVFQKSQLV